MEVVAALIWKNDNFLICQRPINKMRGLLWEFPGGKVEDNELHADALIRECQEELGITIRVGELFMDVIHEYPDLSVHLYLYNAIICHGIPKSIEHNAISWIRSSEIDNYTFSDADTLFIPKLKRVDSVIYSALISSIDSMYAAFQRKLIPSLPKKKILGVRIPVLRKISKSLPNSYIQEIFFHLLPHEYYDEDNLHALLINGLSEFDAAVDALDSFLPYIDNWMTCDIISPKVFHRGDKRLLPHIMRWLDSSHTYTKRYAIGALMRYFLDDAFLPEYLTLVRMQQSNDYYVNMMIAWYFATALVKQYAETICVFEERLLPAWIHNKAIQKALESLRIPNNMKAYLKSLKNQL